MNATDAPPSPRPPNRLVARLCVVVAAALWSSSGYFAKHPIFDGWDQQVRGTLLSFWRALFATLVLLPAIRRPRWRPGLVPLVVCFAVMSLSYLTAMSNTTAANAIWLENAAPWWVFLFSVLLFREPIVRRDLVPLGFGMAGVCTILYYEFQGAAVYGVVSGLVAGISYAGVVVTLRHLREENSSWLVALNHAVAALVLVPWVLVLAQWPSVGQLAMLAAFGVFQMAIPYLLLARGLRAISSQEAVALGMLEPILIPIWAFMVRGEVPARWTRVGASLILMGLVLRYVVWELLAAKRARG
jgi:drug/metabolite transporter (DMT)-like permease